MFAAGDDNVLVAKQLRVSVRSAQRWAPGLAGGRGCGSAVQGFGGPPQA